MDTPSNTGHEILEVIARANRFNRWMFDTVKPFLHGKILEIGSGTGNISIFFLQNKMTITLSDADNTYIRVLNDKFHSCPSLHEIALIDLESENFEQVYSLHQGQYDSIFLLNVLEHIADDLAAIRNCASLLKPGGQLVVLTPAYSFLYSPLDKALGHYRRYTLQKLKRLFAANGLFEKKAFYFNALGIAAWLYAKIFRLKTIPAGEMGFFNKLVPAARLLDTIMFRKAGLSAVLVGKKETPA